MDITMFHFINLLRQRIKVFGCSDLTAAQCNEGAPRPNSLGELLI